SLVLRGVGLTFRVRRGLGLPIGPYTLLNGRIERVTTVVLAIQQDRSMVSCVLDRVKRIYPPDGVMHFIDATNRSPGPFFCRRISGRSFDANVDSERVLVCRGKIEGEFQHHLYSLSQSRLHLARSLEHSARQFLSPCLQRFRQSTQSSWHPFLQRSN